LDKRGAADHIARVLALIPERDVADAVNLGLSQYALDNLILGGLDDSLTPHEGVGNLPDSGPSTGL